MEQFATQIAKKLESAHRRRFSRSIYAPGRTDYYDFTIVPESDDGRVFSMTITFKRGERYCCIEPGCHFGFWDAEAWELLRREFAAVGLSDIGRLKITRVRVIVEKGAYTGMRFPNDGAVLKPRQEFEYELGPFDEAHPEAANAILEDQLAND